MIDDEDRAMSARTQHAESDEERRISWTRFDYEVYSESLPVGDAPSRTQMWAERIILSSDQLIYVSDSEKLRVWINRSAGLVTLVDDRHHTALESPLPFAPLSVLTEVSGLRYTHTPQPDAAADEPTQARVGDADCTLYATLVSAPTPVEIRLWTTADASWDTERFDPLLDSLRQVLLVPFGQAAATRLSGVSGMPVRSEVTAHDGAMTRRTVSHLVAVAAGDDSSCIPRWDGNLVRKERITFDELMALRVGAPAEPRAKNESSVLDVVERFRAGYRERRVEMLENWMSELFTEDVCVLGTDGAFPGTHEWRRGRDAAYEMFERDWRRWGDLRLYREESLLSVVSDSAWVVLFATVTLDRDDREASRRRCLSRISQYAAAPDWSPQRSLYETLADAANVLVQYERGRRFIWPLRVTLGLTRTDEAWRIHFVEFSHPAQGFRTWRLRERDAATQ